MTIKQQGGIFGRNPTFNDVDVEGTLTVNGEPISDFGSMAQQDADSVNIDGGSIDGVTIGTNSPVTDFYAGDLRIDNYIIRSTSSNDVAVVPDGTGIFDVVANSKIRKPNYQDTTLEIANGPATVGNKREILFTDQSGTTAYIRAYGSSYGSGLNNVLQFGSTTNTFNLTPSGNIAFPSGQGIDFSATSGTGTSELFDDYEEGTWTPTVTSTSGTITTVDDVEGFYTKIGREVTVYAHAKTTDNGTGAGNLRFSGLPFTPVSTDMSATGFIGVGWNSSSGKLLRGRITGGNTRIDVGNYDGTYPTANGRSNSVQVTYYV